MRLLQSWDVTKDGRLAVHEVVDLMFEAGLMALMKWKPYKWEGSDSAGVIKVIYNIFTIIFTMILKL